MPKGIDPATICPLADWLVVELDAKASTTAGGIVIPDTAKDPKAMTGTVIAAGPGRLEADERGAFRRVPHTIPAGARVLFGTYSGVTLIHTERESSHKLIRAEDIMALLSAPAVEHLPAATS